jgi:hypothetical protein
MGTGKEQEGRVETSPPNLKNVARSRKPLESGGRADQFNRFVQFSG